MHRIYRLLLTGVISALILAGCAGSRPPVVATIGNETLSLEDFENSYAKNNGGWEKASASSYEDREKFLDLLVKFRLKVLEANNRGLLADSSIKSELEGYEVTVATSYMLEKEIVEPKVKDMYNRRKEEIRASNILIRLGPDATPADTLAAYNKAMRIIGMIPTTAFDSLAIMYSEDQSVASNKGDLGFFSSGRMVAEFEDACYAMKPGEYTRNPVRSQFGYHVIKLHARHPNQGPVHVSHILRNFSAGPDTTTVTDSAWTIYGLARRQKDFAALAQQYSHDPNARTNGGDIGYYERGRIPPEIENLFYNTPLDSVAPPFRMPYGYHIIKVTGYRGIPAFEEIQKELRDQYNQTRYPSDYANFVHELARQYHMTYDTLVITQLMRAFDTTQTPSSWTWSDTLRPEMKSRVILSCEGRPATVNDFVEHINSSPEFKSMVLTPKNVQHMVERLAEARMMGEHARQTAIRYPEFSKLLKEYQDGILLYRVEQDEVWKKVTVNDSLLRAFYDQTKERYRWGKRVNFEEIFVTSDSVAQLAYKELKQGKNFGDVAEKYTMRPGFKEKKGLWGLTPDSLNIFARYAARLPVDSMPPPFAQPDGWSIIKVLGKDSSRVKTFEEATPEVMGVYQDYASKARLEEWITELKSRYPVILNKPMLMEAFKRKPVAVQ
jgi:peptidyl-prolyl cis-trans isomerase SurA